jgi:hypothetical protein
MATVAKSGTPSLATTVPCPAHTISGLYAGEALAAGDLAYIKASDGKVYKSDGSAADAEAKVDGMVLQAAPIGEAVSLYFDVTVRYGAGMTPGARLYLSATDGLIDDAATTGGTAPIGFVVDATRIRVWQSRY